MATYHGMTFIECVGCGYREADDEMMEIWNDMLTACPVDGCGCRDIIWGDTDGMTWRKDGEQRFRIS
jgi:hypothetical protein